MLFLDYDWEKKNVAVIIVVIYDLLYTNKGQADEAFHNYVICMEKRTCW